jgi:hypothetical protein
VIGSIAIAVFLGGGLAGLWGKVALNLPHLDTPVKHRRRADQAGDTTRRNFFKSVNAARRCAVQQSAQ